MREFAAEMLAVDGIRVPIGMSYSVQAGKGTEMRFVNIDLARRLELAEANAARECTQNFMALRQSCGAALLEIMGGVASFTGIDSPITQAVALGLNGPVNEEQMDQLEDFYRSLGAAVNIEVCPLADPVLLELIGRRKYRPIEFSNVLFKEISGATTFDPPHGMRFRETQEGEEKLWAETVSKGFAENVPVTPELVDIMETFAHRESVRPYLAWAGDEIAGGCAFSAHAGVGGLFGASTLPAMRRRGIQSAMISLRVAAAAAAGCDIAMSIAQVGSASHRNLERQGFSVAYTRVKFTG